MATTSQILTWLQMDANGWNREGARGLLPLLNEAQNILWQNECEQATSFNDGELPYIVTTTEKTYTLPSNIWRVADVVTLISLTDVYLPAGGAYLPLGGTNYYYPYIYDRKSEIIQIAGKNYTRVKKVRSYDKSGSNLTRVEFGFDIEASTETYQYVGYTIPTQLTSENIQPTIPDRYHFSHLLPAAKKLVEAFQNGNQIEAREYIEKEIKPDFWDRMNEGAQGRPRDTHRREI